MKKAIREHALDDRREVSSNPPVYRNSRCLNFPIRDPKNDSSSIRQYCRTASVLKSQPTRTKAYPNNYNLTGRRVAEAKKTPDTRKVRIKKGNPQKKKKKKKTKTYLGADSATIQEEGKR